VFKGRVPTRMIIAEASGRRRAAQGTSEVI